MRDKGVEFPLPFFNVIFSSNYRAVKISIDFVDYLVAKTIGGFVEEWFAELPKITSAKWTKWSVKHINLIEQVTSQFSRIGTAAFLALFALLQRHLDFKIAAYALSISMIIGSLTSVLSVQAFEAFSSKLSKSLMPAVVVLTLGDQRAYDDVRSERKKIVWGAASVGIAMTMSIALNVVASYLYSYMTR